MADTEKKGIIGEFKEFIMRGNVMDMAVGVIIGGAFTSIVNSLVDDIIMPVLSVFTGRINFSNLFITLDGSEYKTVSAAKEAGAATFAYGAFIQAVIEFLLVALALFLVIKAINKLHRPQEVAITTKICPFCKSEINKEATKCAFCASEVPLDAE